MFVKETFILLNLLVLHYSTFSIVVFAKVKPAIHQNCEEFFHIYFGMHCVFLIGRIQYQNVAVNKPSYFEYIEKRKLELL